MRPTLALLAALVGVLAPAAGRADDAAPKPASLSLRDALERAVAGNLTLLKQKVALRTSEGNVVSALGTFDFVLAADGTFTHNVNPPLKPMDFGAGVTNTGVLDLSLARALESGGNLTLALQGRASKSSAALTCGSLMSMTL